MFSSGYWGNLALQAWVIANPSVQWAHKQIEPHRGLPFGPFLHTSRPRRQRALTAPLDESEESIWHRLRILSTIENEQRTDDQLDCAFLAKLPLDVRMIVYEMVLGNMVFHLSASSQRTRIFHYVCKHPGRLNDDVHEPCHELSTTRPSSAPREDRPHATGLLALLVTCRKIYSETVGTLYSANTFEFTQNFAAFRFLKVMIPPQRLQNIRHFRIRGWRLARHPGMNRLARRDWSDLFAFFTNDMTGLQSLHLQLAMLQPMEDHIRQTSDLDGASWIKPMVIMAVDANRNRGCRTEIVTVGITHNLVEIYKVIERQQTGVDEPEIVDMTCFAVHKRIRESLSEHG